MKPVVSIKNLSVRYGEFEALNEVNLDIYSDDFLGIIGPNGGGKTTLIKSILGAVKYSGEISYSPDIEDANGRVSIGYLPQVNLFDRAFPISILEVVMSGLQSKKRVVERYTKAERELAMELIEKVGLGKISHKAIGSISGGEMQRTLLCRAIIATPKLLILDEPANFVDNKFEAELYDILKELNKQIPIVMVSHDIGMITTVVKSIVCVNMHVHRHNSNTITREQLDSYDCPIQLVSHGDIPHTVLERHD